MSTSHFCDNLRRQESIAFQLEYRYLKRHYHTIMDIIYLLLFLFHFISCSKGNRPWALEPLMGISEITLLRFVFYRP